MKKILTVIALTMMMSFSAHAADMHGSADMLFDWAEDHLPEYFYPGGQVSQTMGEWYYRCYSDTENCVGINTIGDVYVIGRDFPQLMNVGPMATIMAMLGIGQSGDAGDNPAGHEYSSNGPSCVIDLNMFKSCMDLNGLSDNAINNMKSLCGSGWSETGCELPADMRCREQLNGEEHITYLYVSETAAQVIPDVDEMLRDSCRGNGGIPLD